MRPALAFTDAKSFRFYFEDLKLNSCVDFHVIALNASGMVTKISVFNSRRKWSREVTVRDIFYFLLKNKAVGFVVIMAAPYHQSISLKTSAFVASLNSAANALSIHFADFITVGANHGTDGYFSYSDAGILGYKEE